MTTQAAMIAEILDDTERGAGETDAVRDKIAAAIRYYQPSRFWFNETRDVTFDTVPGQIDYPFPLGTPGAVFYKIDAAIVTQGTTNIDMGVEDYKVLEVLLDGNSTRSLPTVYAYIKKALRLYPAPDVIYPVRLTGHIRIDPPADDSEADNPWFVDAYDLIMCRAKAQLYKHRWGDPNNAALMTDAEIEARDLLFSATADKTGTGVVRSTRY
ncbi:hypothetical protein [Paradevosia shaoguanensis]|uniref:phage adaptor protein n=1 Tax=Paradevosia shaoguanensis TaxID=1335043 RepID=UPI0019311A96|nr:hypothetical protein [Paradevosia shaoguanensis]